MCLIDASEHAKPSLPAYLKCLCARVLWHAGLAASTAAPELLTSLNKEAAAAYGKAADAAEAAAASTRVAAATQQQPLQVGESDSAGRDYCRCMLLPLFRPCRRCR